MGASFASNPTWRDWFSAYMRRTRDRHGQGHGVNASRLRCKLAGRGVGIALGQRLLADDTIWRGELVELTPESLPLGQSHIIAPSIRAARQPDVLAFRRWLLREVG